MRGKRYLANILALVILVHSLLAWTPAARSAIFSIYYVMPGAAGDCSSWASACDLPTALSSAAGGDQVWVAAGFYLPTSTTDRTATFQLKSGIAVYGGFPAGGGSWDQRNWRLNPTILSGDIGTLENQFDNSYHVVDASGVDSSAALDGFTIMNGFASVSGGGIYIVAGSPLLANLTIQNNIGTSGTGGGIYVLNSSPTLNNVNLIHNSSNCCGGGMYAENSTLTFSSVLFTNNVADKGGGLYTYLSQVTGTEVTFSGNHANGGGGMWASDSTVSLVSSIFTGNDAVSGNGGGLVSWNNSSTTLIRVIFENNSAYGLGGGLDSNSSSLSITDSSFYGNTGAEGGAVNAYISDSSISGSTFYSNTARTFGGGMSVYTGTLTLINSTLTNNQAGTMGGGLYLSSSSPILTNITLSLNQAASGGGIYNDFGGAPSMINSILWGNSPEQIAGDPIDTGYSDIQGGYDGLGPEQGNISSDPLLLPIALNGGFTLTQALAPGSPAIDAGSPTVCPEADQRGSPRPVDGDGDGVAVCDMGAYEFLLAENTLFLPVVFNRH